MSKKLKIFFFATSCLGAVLFFFLLGDKLSRFINFNYFYVLLFVLGGFILSLIINILFIKFKKVRKFILKILSPLLLVFMILLSLVAMISPTQSFDESKTEFIISVSWCIFAIVVTIIVILRDDFLRDLKFFVDANKSLEQKDDSLTQAVNLYAHFPVLYFGFTLWTLLVNFVSIILYIRRNLDIFGRNVVMVGFYSSILCFILISVALVFRFIMKVKDYKRD